MTHKIELMAILITISFTHSYKLHNPVLLKESMDLLITNKDGRYIDGTVGSGGHSKAIISSLSEKGSLICLDRDPESIEFVKNIFDNRVTTLLGNFGLLDSLLLSNSLPVTGYSGILLDLGVSNHQFEESSRGFSYKYNGNLDMRMSNPLFDSKSDFKNIESYNTAQYIVNNWSEDRLYRLFKDFGEEPKSLLIAKSIVNYRKVKPIITTFDLKLAVLKGLYDKISITPNKSNEGNTYILNKNDYSVLSRIFQSLRMAVNDELYFLDRFLSIFPNLIGINGRLVVISYHSLEDRMIKTAFRDLSQDKDTNWKIITKKVLIKLIKCVMPSEIEIYSNPKYSINNLDLKVPR